jgi:glutamine synthetase adenylyltransferase
MDVCSLSKPAVTRLVTHVGNRASRRIDVETRLAPWFTALEAVSRRQLYLRQVSGNPAVGSHLVRVAECVMTNKPVLTRYHEPALEQSERTLALGSLLHTWRIW